MMTLALLAGLGVSVVADAVVVGQIDTFENGTTEGWHINLLGLGVPPVFPVNVPTGGPAGVNDNYLRLTSVGGAVAGGRLTVINDSQWAGDYLAAGVNAIAMDLINLGSTNLSLRLLFEDPTLAPPIDVAFSTQSVFLAAGSGWSSVLFPISPGDLTALTGSITTALTNATDIRLYNSPAADFPGPPIAANLGVDNIEARQGTTTVPEPATLALLGLGLAGLGCSRRKH